MQKYVLRESNSICADNTWVFKGYICDNLTSNVGMFPFFTKEEGMKILANFSEMYESDRSYFDETTDTFYIHQIDGDEEYFEEYKGCDIEFQGTIMHLYPIGAGEWVWDEKTLYKTDIKTKHIEATVYYVDDADYIAYYQGERIASKDEEDSCFEWLKNEEKGDSLDTGETEKFFDQIHKAIRNQDEEINLDDLDEDMRLDIEGYLGLIGGATSNE